LSIIIPCLNQIDLLKDCLKSISRQSFKSYEIIVVDGASKDGTNEFLNTISSTIKFISEPDSGIYDAMNKGIKMARGEWLYFMGVDDRFYNDDVLAYIDSLLPHNNIKIVACQIIYQFKDHDSLFVKRRKGIVKPSWSKKIWLKNTLHHQGIFYNKSILKDQVFNIKYKILADYALNLKLWKLNTPVLIIDKIIAKCGTEGLSKKYNWTLYKEEVNIKTDATSLAFYPFFVFLAVIKYCLKHIF